MYQIRLDDLVKSPEIMKVGFNSDRSPKVVPVGGTIRGGFYVGITKSGFVKYNVKSHQRAHLVPDTLRPRVEDLPKRRRRSKVHALTALFLNRNDADVCLEVKDREPWDSRWHTETVAVLRKIGHFHPLVSLSTDGDYALPAELLPDNNCFGS
jgi:hypothetical protein